MWRKEDGNPQTSPEVSPGFMKATTPGKAGASAVGTPTASLGVSASVCQGIKIKGEVTGTEDLFVDGVVDGKITLTNSILTIGPNAKVKGEIAVRELIVRGHAEGKFTATERIQLLHTARVQGELKSEGIAVEEGAQLRGKVEAGKVAGSVTAGETAARGKKAEINKAKDTPKGDEKATSGAASTGAD